MTAYTDEQRQEIMATVCARMAQGEPLSRICENDPDLPHRTTIMEWVYKDDDLADKYARAREAQADYYADEIVQISDTEEDPNRARVRIDARKWTAGKLRPRVYGDRVVNEHVGKDDGPIAVDDPNADARRVAFMLGRAAGRAVAKDTTD